jgi:hypothetical protein
MAKKNYETRADRRRKRMEYLLVAVVVLAMALAVFAMSLH